MEKSFNYRRYRDINCSVYFFTLWGKKFMVEVKNRFRNTTPKTKKTNKTIHIKL